MSRWLLMMRRAAHFSDVVTGGLSWTTSAAPSAERGSSACDKEDCSRGAFAVGSERRGGVGNSFRADRCQQQFLRAVVSWTPPSSDGGSPVTGYVVTRPPGGCPILERR